MEQFQFEFTSTNKLKCELDKITQWRMTKIRRKTVSIGVVEALRGETPDMVCVRVDSALYEAKNNGKNQVFIG